MANEEFEETQLSSQIAAAGQLPPGMMLLKMENESIMSVARAQPRDPVKIVKQLTELIEAYPQAADEAIYVKPVGSVTMGNCPECKLIVEVPYNKDAFECPGCRGTVPPHQKDTWKETKFAEGLSIRAAESIRSIYGFNRLATTTEVLDDGKVKITGIFVDYTAGNITADDRIISPYYKQKGGGMARTPEDRFLNVVVKAEKAKLRRDIILDSVPNIVKAAFRDACEKKLEQVISPEVIDQQILPFFARYGLGIGHLEKIVGRTRSLGWTVADRIKLKQLASALQNEETTAAEILSTIDSPTPAGNGKTPAPAATGAVSGSDLTKDAKKPEKPVETTPAGQGETKTEPAKTEPVKTETAAPSGETKQPAGETTATEAGATSAEPSDEEKAAIAREEFAESCKEKFAGEFDLIAKAKSVAALDKILALIEKDADMTEAEKMVARSWSRARRQAIKGAK